MGGRGWDNTDDGRAARADSPRSETADESSSARATTALPCSPAHAAGDHATGNHAKKDKQHATAADIIREGRLTTDTRADCVDVATGRSLYPSPRPSLCPSAGNGTRSIVNCCIVSRCLVSRCIVRLWESANRGRRQVDRRHRIRRFLLIRRLFVRRSGRDFARGCSRRDSAGRNSARRRFHAPLAGNPTATVRTCRHDGAPATGLCKGDWILHGRLDPAPADGSE